MKLSIKEFQKIADILIEFIEKRYGNEVRVCKNFYMSVKNRYNLNSRRQEPIIGSYFDEKEFLEKWLDDKEYLTFCSVEFHHLGALFQLLGDKIFGNICQCEEVYSSNSTYVVFNMDNIKTIYTNFFAGINKFIGVTFSLKKQSYLYYEDRFDFDNIPELKIGNISQDIYYLQGLLKKVHRIAAKDFHIYGELLISLGDELES